MVSAAPCRWHISENRMRDVGIDPRLDRVFPKYGRDARARVHPTQHYRHRARPPSGAVW
jgi:hypothetical protein